MFGIQFYPTPPELVKKMLSKVDFTNVTYILEPSAGKGDIIDGIKKELKDRALTYSLVEKSLHSKPKFLSFDKQDELLSFASQKFNTKFNSYKEVCDFINQQDLDIQLYSTKSKISEKILEIEAIEIDDALRAILRSKNITVVSNDFLEFNPYCQYELIVMNPPFKDGDKHLLKALKLIENGGQCVCILNSETIKNPYSDSRVYLCNLLNKYNAEIEYISNAFSNSENKTNVEIALVYVNIPKKNIELDIFKKLVLGENYDRKYDEYNDTQLATDDIIGNLVKQYEFEARAGIKIIDTFYSMAQYIPFIKDNKEQRMINLSVYGCPEEFSKVEFSPINVYIRCLRDKYWSLLFNSNELGRLLTETTKNKFISKIREFRDYDFTFSNIKQIQIELVNDLSNNIDEAILAQFDNFTYKYSLGNDTNVHYFNGWRTNDAFMVKNKVIIPMYGIYDRYGWSLYKANDFLRELEKIFVYLDGGKTEGETIDSIIYKRGSQCKYNGEKINSKYFDVEFKKKGTIHIWFTNEELVKKFNIFGCQKHGWLPNSYGRKRYKDMTKEEQEVIDNFEGEKSYENVISKPNFFLSGNQMLQIGVSEE